MTYFLFLFLLLCLVQFLLIASFRKPAFLSRKLKLTWKKETSQIIFVSITLVLYYLLFTKLVAAHQMQLLPLVSVEHPPVSSAYLMPTQGQKLYQELGYRESANFQSFYFLYLGKDLSAGAIHTLAVDLRKAVCKKVCIVNLYDTADAYNQDMERLTITSSSVMNDWNQKHYVYVAQHFLAYLGPSQTYFSYYPFKDWYYRSRTSQK